MLLLLLMRRGTQVGCDNARLTDLLVGRRRRCSLSGVLKLLRLNEARRSRLILGLGSLIVLLVQLLRLRLWWWCLTLALRCLVVLQMNVGLLLVCKWGACR